MRFGSEKVETCAYNFMTVFSIHNIIKCSGRSKRKIHYYMYNSKSWVTPTRLRTYYKKVNIHRAYHIGRYNSRYTYYTRAYYKL